ncbi:MAG: polysaccharide biosynthesis/export family protein [Candidatus Binatia bacterium]
MRPSLQARWLPLAVALLWIGGCAATPESARVQSQQGPATPSSSTSVNEINQSLSLAAAQSNSSPSDYRLGPDDLIQVTIYNIPESEARVTPRVTTLRVSQQGMIMLPLIGEIAVKGKTTAALEQELAKRYDKYIKRPQIGVLITEYRQRVSVMGAVQKPGVFELTGPKTVIDMLAWAGGVTEKAGNQVHVYRQEAEGARQSYVIDLMVLANSSGLINDRSAAMVNMPVQAGDVINVPQAGMFFVDGAVNKPGSYPLGRYYSLSQALATAGGVNPELADYDSVSIFRRRSPTSVETIPINLSSVMSGSAPDPQIAPDDVIVVPMSSVKYFVKRFVGTIISGVSVGALVGGS